MPICAVKLIFQVMNICNQTLQIFRPRNNSIVVSTRKNSVIHNLYGLLVACLPDCIITEMNVRFLKDYKDSEGLKGFPEILKDYRDSKGL